MRRGKRVEVPAGLLRLQRRFANWRKSRQQGERIPERLWNSAAKLAATSGLHQTAQVLNLDYYSLKRRMAAPGAETTATTAFIELPSPPVVQANECIIEFEDATGASMRVHLKGTDLPDVLALGRSFWNAE